VSSRLNQLFQADPEAFLRRTVLFSDKLRSPESLVMTQNRIAHYIDIEPLGIRTTLRVLSSLQAYADMPLIGYFARPQHPVLLPKADSSSRFVFLPEFVSCRVLLRRDGSLLRIEVEQDLMSRFPGPETLPDSPYLDSFAYWDYTTGHLVGRIRATAVLVKHPDRPWTAYMQQIVGVEGHEVVRSVFSKEFCY
jgi:hypothetical protein